MTNSDDPIPNLDFEKVSEFLDEPGAIELIAFLDNEGHRFDEIDKTLDVSRGYLNDRKGEAIGLNLIEAGIGERDGKQVKVWKITSYGRYIQHQMREIGFQNSHKRFLNALSEFESKKAEFEKLAESPDNIKEKVIDIRERKFNIPDEPSETITEDDIPEDFDEDSTNIDEDISTSDMQKPDERRRQDGQGGEDGEEGEDE